MNSSIDLGMNRILILSNIRPARYPANLKSSRILAEFIHDNKLLKSTVNVSLNSENKISCVPK